MNGRKFPGNMALVKKKLVGEVSFHMAEISFNLKELILLGRGDGKVLAIYYICLYV